MHIKKSLFPTSPLFLSLLLSISLHLDTHTHFRSNILMEFSSSFCHFTFIFFSFEKIFMLKIYTIDFSLCFHQILLCIFSGYAVQFLQVQSRWIIIFIMLKCISLYQSMFYTLNSIYIVISISIPA